MWDGPVMDICDYGFIPGTGQRNIADGLSVVECVRQVVEDYDEQNEIGVNLHQRQERIGECIHELEPSRDELREQVAKLREALALAGIPLEVLHATERGGTALCGEVQDSIAVAVPVIREALAATAPKEPA